MPGYVFQFRLVFQEFPTLLEGALLTLHLSLLTLGLSLAIGTIGALCRLSGITWVRRLATWYVEGVRNTPLLVQLFFIYKLHQSGKMKELYVKWFGSQPARVSPNW